MWTTYSSASVFTLLAAVCGMSIIIGLPGIWLMILLAVTHEVVCSWWLANPGDWFAWTAIGIAVVIAAGAEAVEFLATAAGAKAGGASKWGVFGAMVGGVCGVIGGTLFIPVPIVGTLGGAAVGAACGAIAGEICGAKRALKDSMAPAAGAAVGRILGVLAKFPFAIAAWLILVVGAFWR